MKLYTSAKCAQELFAPTQVFELPVSNIKLYDVPELVLISIKYVRWQRTIKVSLCLNIRKGRRKKLA